MHPLSANEVVRAWEWGQDKHPIDRAVSWLALAQPELSSQQAASLTVGQRNSRLLTLREKTLGPILQGFAHCPQCRAPLEFSVDVAAIRLSEPASLEYEVNVADVHIRLRLPNSFDLAAVVDCSDIEVARRLLIECCIVQAQQAGQDIAASQLSSSVILALAQAVNDNDPQADVHFDLHCVDCGHNWSALFDIVSFFWAELSALAKRLLLDVHTLARAYGWSEADILAMSATRRKFYLELVS